MYNIEDIAYAVKHSEICPFDFKRECARNSETADCKRCTLNYFKERDQRMIEEARAKARSEAFEDCINALKPSLETVEKTGIFAMAVRRCIRLIEKIRRE